MKKGVGVVKNVEAAAMKHLERLCGEIGPRPVGSKENLAAAEYIQSVFEASGLAVEVQEFPCPVWEGKETRLELGGDRLVAAANAFSPPCDVTAPSIVRSTFAGRKASWDRSSHPSTWMASDNKWVGTASRR
ncbi:MAG: hypothetical protein ACE5JI_22390 [Acidobacteriota bacterium]